MKPDNFSCKPLESIWKPTKLTIFNFSISSRRSPFLDFSRSLSFWDCVNVVLSSSIRAFNSLKRKPSYVLFNVFNYQSNWVNWIIGLLTSHGTSSDELRVISDKLCLNPPISIFISSTLSSDSFSFDWATSSSIHVLRSSKLILSRSSSVSLSFSSNASISFLVPPAR